MNTIVADVPDIEAGTDSYAEEEQQSPNVI